MLDCALAAYFVIWKGNHILSLYIMICESWHSVHTDGAQWEKEKEEEND